MSGSIDFGMQSGDGWTDEQERLLSVIPHVTGSLSIVGSAYIIYDIASDRKKWSSTYHRLLFAMGIVDFVSSFATSFSTIPMPADAGDLSYGTDATCALQGFFVHFNIASPLYNLMLSIYFLLTVTFKWKKEDIKAKIEIWLHGIPLAWSFVTAVVVLAQDGFNDSSLWCWINGSPKNCEGDDCDRCPLCFGVYRWWFFFGPLWLAAFGTIVVMGMLVSSVRKTEQKAAKYRPTRVHRKLEKRATQSARDFSNRAVKAASEEYFSNASFRAKEKGGSTLSARELNSSSNMSFTARSTNSARELSSSNQSFRAKENGSKSASEFSSNQSFRAKENGSTNSNQSFQSIAEEGIISAKLAKDSSNRSHQSFESIPEEGELKDSSSKHSFQHSIPEEEGAPSADFGDDKEAESSFSSKEERDSSSTKQASKSAGDSSKSSRSVNFSKNDNGNDDNDNDKEQAASRGERDSIDRLRSVLDCCVEKEGTTNKSAYESSNRSSMMVFKSLRDFRTSLPSNLHGIKRSGWRGSSVADLEERRERRKALRMTRVVTGQAFRYCAVFWITWVFGSTNRVLQLTRGHSYFWVMFLHVIFTPMQGLLNCIVYVDLRVRKWWKAKKLAWSKAKAKRERRKRRSEENSAASIRAAQGDSYDTLDNDEFDIYNEIDEDACF